MEDLTKSELLDWIDLLYMDLSKDNLLIGGYYFTFDHLIDFFILQQELNSVNSKILDKINTLSKKNEKSPSKDAQAAINKLYAELQGLKVELNCKNKLGKKVTVSCSPEEFKIVFDTLLEFKRDAEYFKQFCTEEANKVEQKEIGSFMWFLNDMMEDIRDRFHGKIEQ